MRVLLLSPSEEVADIRAALEGAMPLNIDWRELPDERAPERRAGPRTLRGGEESDGPRAREEPDIVVMAIRRGATSTMAQCVRLLRDRGQRLPILVVGRGCERGSVVHVLEAGADDCLTGEFDHAELRARFFALLRRSAGLWVESEGPVSLHRGSLTARVDDRECVLTRTQFSVLEYLVRHRNTWLTSEAIIRDVFGTSHQKGSSLVRFHVHNLRRALGPAATCLHWKRGHGYMFSTSRAPDARIAVGAVVPLALAGS